MDKAFVERNGIHRLASQTSTSGFSRHTEQNEISKGQLASALRITLRRQPTSSDDITLIFKIAPNDSTCLYLIIHRSRQKVVR